ncbi:MAG TPA: L-threonylcarbamoyladenylate synthase [Catalimonadaceae bacterium]|nr:L-threonylcarbamoyladenylate synthase [Catalimonadaceae bacterium]HPI09869.1 L-threonylcarbamoyladenylate synthase [Catalimonadaceae bacterium]
MAAKLIKIHPENPDLRKIEQVVQVLRDGGLVIYPTDTVYGIGCDIFHPRAIEKIAKLKNLKPEKANFAFICHDMSHLADFARVSTPVYKVMKKALPGPFTFVLPATAEVPRILNNKRKTIGIRIPDNNIPRMLVRELGHPILTSSIVDEDDVLEYSTDPELIFEKFENQVDIIIDGGYGHNVASTIVLCENDEFEVVRQGLGDLSQFV